MTAPAVVAWAARVGWIHLDGTPLAFLGHPIATYVLTALMIGELIGDKLPRTPSRTAPGPFIARIVAGALAGAALTAGLGQRLALGAIVGACGAVAGTLGGYRARTGLVRALGTPDYVVALAEDVVAVGGGFLLVCLAGRFAPLATFRVAALAHAGDTGSPAYRVPLTRIPGCNIFVADTSTPGYYHGQAPHLESTEAGPFPSTTPDARQGERRSG
jgi:uncharacterized membrane protein